MNFGSCRKVPLVAWGLIVNVVPLEGAAIVTLPAEFTKILAVSPVAIVSPTPVELALITLELAGAP